MSLALIPNRRPEESDLLGIEPDDTVTNQENLPLPWFIGPGRLAVKWISGVYNRDAVEPQGGGGKGGKGGGGSASKSSWVNYGDVAGLYGGGPVDELRYIVYDNRILWEGSIKRNGSNPLYAQVNTGDYGTFRVYWGVQTAVDSLVLSGVADDHPPMRGIPYVVGKRVRFGAGKDAPGNLVLGVSRTAWGAPSVMDRAYDVEGVNPFAGCAEVLLEDMQGLGLDASTIDEDQWDAIADLAKKAEAYPISGNPSHVASFGHVAYTVTSQQPARRVMNDMLSYVDGFLRVKGATLEAGLESHDGTVPEGLPELTHHSFVGVPVVGHLDTRELGQLYLTYRDRNRHHKRATLPVNSLADTDLEPALVRSDTENREGFCTEYQAERWGNEYLSVVNEQRLKVTGNVFTDELQGRVEGDEINLNYLPDSVDTTFRIVRLEDTEDPEVKKVELHQKAGVYQLAYVPPEELRPTIDLTAPDAVTNYQLLQATKRYAGGVPAVWILAEKPTANAIGVHIHYSQDDASYDYVGDQNSFALRGTLDENITAADASFDITATGLDILKLQEQSDAAMANDTLLLIVNGEIKSIGDVVANGSDSYTVTTLPGRLDTVAAAHTTGDTVWIIERSRLELLEHKDFPYEEEGRYFKLQPYSYSGGPRDLGDVTSFEFEFADIFVADPVNFQAVGLAGGFDLQFEVEDKDVIGARLWSSYSEDGFTEEPTFVFSISTREAEQGFVRFPYFERDFQEGATIYFKIQLFDNAPVTNYSNVVGPISNSAFVVNKQGPRVFISDADNNPWRGYLGTLSKWRLQAYVTNYSSAVSYQWYRSPVGDPEGTMTAIPGATSNILDVPVLDVAPSGKQVTPQARRYEVRANDAQSDWLTLYVPGTDAYHRDTPLFRLTNEVVTIDMNEDLSFPLPYGAASGVRGYRGSNGSMANMKGENPDGVHTNLYNFWLVLPDGLDFVSETGADAWQSFKLVDPAYLAGGTADTTFNIDVWATPGGYPDPGSKIATLPFVVKKNVRVSGERTMVMEVDGETHFEQPIIAANFHVTATMTQGEYEAFSSQMKFVVASDGKITQAAWPWTSPDGWGNATIADGVRHSASPGNCPSMEVEFNSDFQITVTARYGSSLIETLTISAAPYQTPLSEMVGGLPHMFIANAEADALADMVGAFGAVEIEGGFNGDLSTMDGPLGQLEIENGFSGDLSTMVGEDYP